MTHIYFKLALAGILGGGVMIVAGLGIHWEGAAAILLGIGALCLGIRDLRAPATATPSVAIRAPSGPYTAADFPCPESVPGRDQVPAAAGPVPFAVIAPGQATAEEFREMGRRLRVWQDSDPRVTQIIGLEQLLVGQPPETPAWHFMLPMPPDTERVALVFVTGEAATESTTRELEARLRGCPIAMLVSPEYYSAINR